VNSPRWRLSSPRIRGQTFKARYIDTGKVRYIIHEAPTNGLVEAPASSLVARTTTNTPSSGDVARHRRLLREGHQQKPQNEPRGRCWTDRGSCPEQRSVCCCAASGWPRRRPASICQRGVVTQDAESSQEIWRPLRQSMTKCPGSEAVVRVPRAMGQTAAAT
jgi:hypothetical protein